MRNFFKARYDDRGAKDEGSNLPDARPNKFVANPQDADSFARTFFDDENENLEESSRDIYKEALFGQYYAHLIDGAVFKIEEHNRELTKDEERQYNKMCDAARRDEMDSVMKHGAVRPVEKAQVIHCGKPMTSRLVYTWKKKDGKWIAKCRYCIRGFLDPQVNTLVAAAATASTISQRPVCSYAVNHAMKVVSLDVATAFLQGLTFQELNKSGKEAHREAYADPPPGLMEEMQKWYPEVFKEVRHVLPYAITMDLIKGVYGLKDAPRLWRENVHRFMMGLGFYQSRYDEYLYLKKQFKGAKVNRALITVHVDDFECAGKDVGLEWFEEKVREKFGAPKRQEKSFRHCGVDYWQSSDCTKMIHYQIEFVEQVELFPVTKEGRKSLESPLTQEENSCFRSIIGGCQWLARTRGDGVAETNRLQSKTGAPVVKDLIDANVLLRKMKDTKNESVLLFKKQ